MRKLLIVLSLLFFTTQFFASHIVGGDLHYVHLGGENYQIILKIYRDCENSTTNFDDPSSIGIFNNGVLVQNVEIYLFDAVVSDIPANANDPCLIPPTEICVKEAIYTMDIVLPYLEGGYVLAYQRCCRTNALVNANSFDDLGITLTTTIPDHELVGHNSNPDFLNFPPIAICLGSPFSYDHSAIDIDGDSLSYEFCNPLLGGGIGQYYLNPPNPPPYNELIFIPPYDYEYPVASSPAFAIDPITGLLTGTPNELGVYVVGVCIKEYRDGEVINITNRDFLFNVVLCSSEVTVSLENLDPCLGLTAEFITNSVAADNYFWEFGDPNSEDDFSFEFDPDWTYSEEGEYTAWLHVNVGLECEDSTSIDISAYEPPDISFDLVDFYCEDGQVIMDYDFTAETEDDFVYYWFFGFTQEPTNGTGEDPPLVAYDEPGTYSVSLTVVDSPCQSILFNSFTIDPFPVAEIEEFGNECNGLTFDFVNESTGAESYSWDFGDPSTTTDVSTEENPSYTYSSEGTYTVTLIVDEESACPDEYTIDVLAYEPPEIEIGVVNSYCEDGNIIFEFENVGSNSSEAIYNWDFSGNAEPGDTTGINTGEIIFPESGTYTINLELIDLPCIAEASDEISVLDAPLAMIEPQSTFCNGLTIPFTNLSENADTYLWDFGDGSDPIFGLNPNYTYDDYGTYTVTLTATNSTCSDDFTIEVEVVSIDPIDMDYSIDVPSICDPSTEVLLEWNGIGADEVSWSMGDGNILEGESQIYEYASLGGYTVLVTAYNVLCDYTEVEAEEIEIDFFVVESEVKIPNIFTPNADLINNDFRISYVEPIVNLPIGTTILDYIESYSMEVYDRWGTKVFDSKDGDEKYWDGSNREDGTFYYIIQYKRNCLDDEVQIKSGYVQLIK